MTALWTKAMKEALPRSKAKTADGLLAEIQRLILAEPKRYFQGDWIRLDLTTPQEDREGSNTPEFPACGTIGCVAGWCAVLTLPRAEVMSIQRRSWGIMEHAQKTLGLDNIQAGELFDGIPDRFLDNNEPTQLKARPGTKAYARLGWKHIQAFREKYRAQLRAHRLKA